MVNKLVVHLELSCMHHRCVKLLKRKRWYKSKLHPVTLAVSVSSKHCTMKFQICNRSSTARWSPAIRRERNNSATDKSSHIHQAGAALFPSCDGQILTSRTGHVGFASTSSNFGTLDESSSRPHLQLDLRRNKYVRAPLHKSQKSSDLLF